MDELCQKVKCGGKLRLECSGVARGSCDLFEAHMSFLVCGRHSLQKRLEEPELLHIQKMTEAFSPRRLEWMLSNNLVIFCYSMDQASPESPKS